jgi:hypothetical protein
MQISLRLGEVCNKNCSYCDYNEIRKVRKIDRYLFKSNLPMVFEILNNIDNLNLSITGGETGLIPLDILTEVFDSTNKLISVPTNGLFIEKQYHIKFKDRINIIYYHCVDEITNTVIVDPIMFDNVEYFILVHKDNLKYLDSFLKNNPNLLFTIKLIEQRGEKQLPLLEQLDLYELLHILEKHTNYKYNIVEYLHWYCNVISTNRIESIRYKCSTHCYIPQIDFVYNCIRKCYKSYTDFPTVSLTRENVINSINVNVPEFSRFDTICYDCTYLYQFLNIDKIFKERVNISLNNMIKRKKVGLFDNGKKSI